MVSKLAMEDIESLMEEGCVVRPSDVIRLNALGLKLEKRPDFRLATLPRVALCGGVLFTQPSIEQDIFLDNMFQVFSRDEGTRIAVEAYVLAHPDENWSKRPMFPRLFGVKCAAWIRKHLGKEVASKVRAALDFCKYGMDPLDGEFPAYAVDETFDKWYDEGGPKSPAMRKWLEACALGIDSAAALKATSPQLAAMIERAYLLNDRKIGDDEKQLTAEYFATLKEIQEQARAARDAKKGPENG
jgi:hypothetical protein